MVLKRYTPGRALCGGTLTYRMALARRLCTIPEIHDELARIGHLQCCDTQR